MPIREQPRWSLLNLTSMNAVVIYESLTGNTKRAAEIMGDALRRSSVDTIVCPTTAIDYASLSAADLVVVGTWTDGIFVMAQKPARSGRLRALPVIAGKRCAVFCTFALDPGKTIDKLTRIMESRGAEVVGGMAIRRDDIDGGSVDFVERLLAAVDAPA